MLRSVHDKEKAEDFGRCLLPKVLYKRRRIFVCGSREDALAKIV